MFCNTATLVISCSVPLSHTIQTILRIFLNGSTISLDLQCLNKKFIQCGFQDLRPWLYRNAYLDCLRLVSGNRHSPIKLHALIFTLPDERKAHIRDGHCIISWFKLSRAPSYCLPTNALRQRAVMNLYRYCWNIFVVNVCGSLHFWGALH